MTGVQEFNKRFDQASRKKIESNNDIPYLEEFYNYTLLNHESSTAYQYLHHVIHFMNASNKKDPSELTLNDYTRYFACMKDSTTGSHQKAAYAALKKYSLFLSINKVSDDYMKYIGRPNKKETASTITKRENDYFTAKEMRGYLKKVKDYKQNDIWGNRDYTMVKLLMTTGIRRAAIDKLDVDDINFDDKFMVVTEKGAKVRKIYLSDDMIDDIKEWIKYRDKINPNTKALFISNRKQRMTTQNINSIVKKYDADAAHPHKFRASFASVLFERTNGDLYTVQECMGHSTPAMTERYIRGQKGDASKKAAAIMSRVI